MSLPASQQRALDAMDSDLRTADRRLARMFGVFTELTRLEKMPLAEMFQPVRWWTRAGRRTGRRQRTCTLPGCRRPGHRRLGWPIGSIVVLPLLLAATLSLLLLSVLTTSPAGVGRCTQAYAFVSPVRMAAAGGCSPGRQTRTSYPAGG